MHILGVDALPEEARKQAMEQFGAIVYQAILLRALDLLNEDDKTAFGAIIEGDQGPEAMFTFLAEKVPNIDAIAAEEAEKLRAESADILSQIG